ncbi:hypothetical protein [Sphingobacterium sp.]|uniref:hypothetical protein n=1 Tax=Sphingobacterium sp. TaxID=341027 RepID=UPI0028AA6E41|nr:hypothetical protein [Sphingobacterium sp.]
MERMRGWTKIWVLNQDERDGRMDQDLGFNQDERDGRMDQDLGFEPGWKGREDGARLYVD